MAAEELKVVKQEAYEYMVILHPTVKEAEEGKGSEIIVPLTQVCATRPDDVLVIASRKIPDQYVEHVSRTETILRPFRTNRQ